jgi:hypothetical protein
MKFVYTNIILEKTNLSRKQNHKLSNSKFNWKIQYNIGWPVLHNFTWVTLSAKDKCLDSVNKEERINNGDNINSDDNIDIKDNIDSVNQQLRNKYIILKPNL